MLCRVLEIRIGNCHMDIGTAMLVPIHGAEQARSLQQFRAEQDNHAKSW